MLLNSRGQPSKTIPWGPVVNEEPETPLSTAGVTVKLKQTGHGDSPFFSFLETFCARDSSNFRPESFHDSTPLHCPFGNPSETPRNTKFEVEGQWSSSLSDLVSGVVGVEFRSVTV